MPITLQNSARQWLQAGNQMTGTGNKSQIADFLTLLRLEVSSRTYLNFEVHTRLKGLTRSTQEREALEPGTERSSSSRRW